MGFELQRREELKSIGAYLAMSVLPGFAKAAAMGRADTVQTLLDSYVTNRKVAGAVAVVGTRTASRVMCSGKIALKDDSPNADPNSLWRIYSMTKLVTGAAAMMLIEDGSLNLDMPVSDVFPSFSHPSVLVK